MVNFFSAAEKTVYCITVSKRHIANCQKKPTKHLLSVRAFLRVFFVF